VAAPDRVFLNLENVRGQSDATAFSVYLGVGDEEDPAEHPERLAGSIAPFGVSQASDFDDEHAGQGLTFVLEITDIIDQLHLEGGFDVDSLPVRIVPVRPISRKSELSIGRISIFRQGR
jgi:tyrosinase